MIITRPLVALAIVLIGVALPGGAARAGSPWPDEATVDERPPDLPPWLIAPRLGRPIDDPSRDDLMGASGLSDLGALLLRDTPSPIEADPLTLRTSATDPTDLRTLLA